MPSRHIDTDRLIPGAACSCSMPKGFPANCRIPWGKLAERRGMMPLRRMIFRILAANTKTMEKSGPSDETGLDGGAAREVPRLGNLISEVEGV